MNNSKANIKEIQRSPQYSWVNYAKCFSMLLVISYHTPHPIGGYIGDILSLLRMPAFFMISGFLFKQEKFPTFGYFIKHRSIQLLVPYTFFFIVFYMLWIVVGRNMIKGADLEAPLEQPVIEFFYGSPSLVVAPYWFICCLFSIQIIYYLLTKYLSRTWVIIVVLILPIFHTLLGEYKLPWNLSLAFLYIPFYAFSNLYKDFILKLTLKQYPLIITTLLISLTGIYFINETTGIGRDIMVVACGLLILPAYILFIKSIPKLKIDRAIEYIGKNTIIILALQNYIIGLFKIFAKSFVDSGGIGVNITITIITLLTCYIPIVFINKYIPFAIGRGRYFEEKLQR